MVLFVGSALESVLESAVDSSVGIGPATRCDAAYLRWGVLNPCDVSKSHMMLCDAFSNMLVISLQILEYLSYLLSDFQTDFSKMMGI